MSYYIVRLNRPDSERRLVDQHWTGRGTDASGGVPRFERFKTGGSRWYINNSFGDYRDAVDAILSLRNSVPLEESGTALGVENEDGDLLWQENNFPTAVVYEETYVELTIYPQEDSMGAVPNQTLNISKDALVTRLTERQKEEEQKRQEAADAITARRKAAQDAVASLDPDELLNLVQKYVNSNLDDIVEMVKDAKETGRLKSPDAKPNQVETAIDKWLRVLQMSTDATIEVSPSDSVYPLL